MLTVQNSPRDTGLMWVHISKGYLKLEQKHAMFYVIVKLIILLTNIFILLDATILTSFYCFIFYW